MEFTQDELKLIEVMRYKRRAQAKAELLPLMESVGVDSARLSTAWSGLIEKGTLRRICDETAELTG